MALFFFDSSALVKRYVSEAGSTWINFLLNGPDDYRAYAARITVVEVISAVVRRQRGGSLSEQAAAGVLGAFRDDLAGRVAIVEITKSVLNQAAEFAETIGLRAYDAVQLAAAFGLNRRRVSHGLGPLTLVSSDDELNAGAVKLGLTVENPNLHP